MTSLVANLYGLPIDNLPTCGVVHLQFNENDWSAVSSAPGLPVPTLIFLKMYRVKF